MTFSKNKSASEVFGLKQKHLDMILDVLKQYPQVLRVLLFGSRAKGTYKSGSDVDLALDGSDLTEALLTRIQSDFEESTLPYYFDVIDLKVIDSMELLQHIHEFGVLIYEKKSS